MGFQPTRAASLCTNTEISIAEGGLQFPALYTGSNFLNDIFSKECSLRNSCLESLAPASVHSPKWSAYS